MFLTAEYEVIKIPWHAAISGISFSCNRTKKTDKLLSGKFFVWKILWKISIHLWHFLKKKCIEAEHLLCGVNRPLVPPRGKTYPAENFLAQKWTQIYLVAGEGASFMQNSHSEWRPPGVELLNPLVHDCSRTHNDCRTQTSIPTTNHVQWRDSDR